MALCSVINEIMYLIRTEKADNKYLRHQIKRDFNLLETLTGRMAKFFENSIKDDEMLKEGYEAYTEGFKEMLYDHLESLEKI